MAAGRGRAADDPGHRPAYLIAAHRRGIDPSAGRDLALAAIGSTGSPLPASTAAWVNEVLPEVWLSQERGHGHRLGLRGWRSHRGRATRRDAGPRPRGTASGGGLNAEGRPVVDEVGELVVTRPMPSMPLYFWDDADGARYRDAYFSTFPGVWRHGDWMTVTRHGGVVVHGRSDATMNEAAGGVFFLVSPWSNYVHGQVLNITGGQFTGMTT